MNNDRLRLLLVLLAVLVVILSWRYGGSFFSGDDPADRARRTREEAMRGEVLELQLAQLEVPARGYERGRDIFRFGPRERKPPPPPPPRVVPTGPVKPPPPPPPVVPKPPPIDVTLVGIFGPQSRRIAVFKDGEDILNALRDDVIKDKFIVHQIDLESESVQFKFVGFEDVEPQRVVLARKKK